MTKYIALLRAINVGGHTIKMDVLREIFEALGFSSVETFIASGNVIFETRSKDVPALEKLIEQRLKDELGYEIATFLRTDSELANISKYKPFKQSELDKAGALNVAFLHEAPNNTAKRALMAYKSNIDDFHLHGCEIYWLCLKKQSESKFSNAMLEKALGMKSTLRGFNTIQKMAEKYSK
jgi:uncharacterized protein (DUF1697 family)